MRWVSVVCLGAAGMVFMAIGVLFQVVSKTAIQEIVAVGWINAGATFLAASCIMATVIGQRAAFQLNMPPSVRAQEWGPPTHAVDPSDGQFKRVIPRGGVSTSRPK